MVLEKNVFNKSNLMILEKKYVFNKTTLADGTCKIFSSFTKVTRRWSLKEIFLKNCSNMSGVHFGSPLNFFKAPINQTQEPPCLLRGCTLVDGP